MDQGCKRIAHLIGNRNLLIAEKRKQGYIDALKENGLPIDESLIVESGIMMDGAAVGAEKLLKLPQPPDGIFAINDPAAIGAMKILKRHGIRIPEDIAIIGFSESRMATIIEPNLSSVEQPTFEMGRVAAQLLLEQIDSKMQVIPKTVILEPKLNMRESSLRILKATAESREFRN
jgi:LacI family transcriptional regulator